MAAPYAPIREAIFATVTVLYCERLTWKEHFPDLDQTLLPERLRGDTGRKQRGKPNRLQFKRLAPWGFGKLLLMVAK